jgi:hypothetical protein
VYADELNTPLGQHRDEQDAKRPLGLARVLVALLGLSGLAAAGWALYSHNPFSGQSVAIVPAKPAPPTVVGTDKPDAAPTTTGTIPSKPTSEPPPGSKTITIIDGATGARKDIVVPQ